MSTATMTSKGRLTVPADVRRDLGLEAGVQVEFIRVGPGEYRLVPKTRRLRQSKGCLPRPETPVSLAAMDAAVAAGATAGTAVLRQG